MIRIPHLESLKIQVRSLVESKGSPHGHVDRPSRVSFPLACGNSAITTLQKEVAQRNGSAKRAKHTADTTAATLKQTKTARPSELRTKPDKTDGMNALLQHTSQRSLLNKEVSGKSLGDATLPMRTQDVRITMLERGLAEDSNRSDALMKTK